MSARIMIMSTIFSGFGGDLTINIIASIITSVLLLAVGFVWGKYKERRRYGRRLEEYDFYPYTVNRDNFPEFSLKDFRLGMHYFLRNNDPTAARQLIFIGEQNNVRTQLEPTEQKVYARFFEKIRRTQGRRRYRRISRKFPPHRPVDWKIIPRSRNRNSPP